MTDKLSQFFQKFEIPFDTVGGKENKAIQSAFKTTNEDGEELTFPLLAFPFEDVFGDAYYRFTIVPFIKQPYSGYPTDLYIMVGQINHNLPQLKFAFDDDEDLELIYDILRDDLDEERFHQIIQVLADYAGMYYSQIKNLIEHK